MEHMILLIAIFMIGTITFVLITRPGEGDRTPTLGNHRRHPRCDGSHRAGRPCQRRERSCFLPKQRRAAQKVEEKHRNIGVVRGDVESGQRIVGSTPHTVADEDLRNVVNLASEIEDIAPAERASLDRLETELDPPSFEPPSFERDEGNG